MILERGRNPRSAWRWQRGVIFLLLIPSLLLAGCGADLPESGTQLSPLATEQGEASVSVLPTATLPLPTDTPVPPTDTPLPPTDTPVPPTARPDVHLALLHTNDNWGETEPCG